MAYNANDSPINFNFKQYNSSTSALQKIEYSETFNQPLLQNPSRFKVAVTRLKIPTAALETFIMDNNEDYTIALFGPSTLQPSVVGALSYRYRIPDVDIVDSFGCCDGRNMKYYSTDQLIDTISRVMYRCYSDYIQDNSSVRVGYGSLLLSNAATVTSTFVISGVYTSLANMRVVLKNIKVSDAAINGDGTFSRVNLPIRVWVQAPGSTDKVYVYCHAGYHNWSNSADLSNYELHFTERAYSSFPEYYDPKTNLTTKLNVLPTESFLSMHGLNMNGTWTVGLDSDRAFFGRVDYYVHVDGNLTSSPYLPAALTLDPTTKKFKFNYQAKMVQSALKWALSPKLHYMLNMGANRAKPDVFGTSFIIDYPALTQTYAGTEMLSFDQEQSTEYLLVNLSRIIVRSSSLSTESEYGAGMNFDNTITDFMIDTSSSTEPGTLIFSESAGVHPWRRYKINSTTAMTRLDLSITAEYVNNITRDIYVPPGLSAMARISFFPQ